MVVQFLNWMVYGGMKWQWEKAFFSYYKTNLQEIGVLGLALLLRFIVDHFSSLFLVLNIVKLG